jgi:AsmA protein
VKNIEGKYNFERIDQKSTERPPGAASSLNNLKVTNGALVYLDKKTGEKIEFNDFDLAVKGLSIAGKAIKSASFSGSITCREVLRQDFRIENLSATVKAVKGLYNFEPLTIGALDVLDRLSGKKTQFKEINLAIKDLSVANSSDFVIKNISFTGELDCEEVQKNDLKINNVKSSIKTENGIFFFNPIVMDIFGAKGEGDATLDNSDVEILYKINLKIAKLDFEKFEQSFGINKVIGGKGDLFAALTMKGAGSHRQINSLDGSFSLRGDNLIIYNMDLDKVLSSYETSQEFNLVDLGAFFIAGPLSTFAVKAYRYGDLYNQTRDGQGAIMHFNSHWKIKNGVADATDCALATRRNRVAIKGKLDLVRERYDDVIVALLDEKGCAKFKQSISGSFLKPRISAVSAAQSLAGPFSDLYRKAKRFVRGGRCEVIYSGSVQQPSN